MQFFFRNVYLNLFEQKFSSSSNLSSNRILFELKFEELENLSDEMVLKSFYFFFLVFGRIPSLRDFKSRYHLGKTFYTFSVFITKRQLGLDFYLFNFLQSYLIDSNKLTLGSDLFYANARLKISDLRVFYFVESNPHFFKWDKELNILVYPGRLQSSNLTKFFNVYFWNLASIRSKNYFNFWNYYVS